MNHGIDTGFMVAAEVSEHPSHQAARSKFEELTLAGDTFMLAPQVLAEFIHIVTDPKRFRSPLDVDSARDLAEKWWNAKEVVHVMPDHRAVSQFIQWHRMHRLGRKRLLDTLLAATYWSGGTASLLTTNAADFSVFGGFHCISP